MLNKIHKIINQYFFVSVPDDKRSELISGINQLNLVRGKITAFAFIFIEFIVLIYSYLDKKAGIFEIPYLYYTLMYLTLIFLCFLFICIFTILSKNVPNYPKMIPNIGAVFTFILLAWAAMISLLDQYATGQIAVYAVAIVAIACTPISHPITLFIIYLIVHSLFIILIPCFQESPGFIQDNIINTTTIIIISWFIAYMRYLRQIEDFNNKLLVKEKSAELERVNKELEEANRKLEILSKTDSLTGIWNRSVFERSLTANWESCKLQGLPISMIMLDIDFFKPFNDHYGHQKGDYCLKLVAEALSSCIRRSSDIVTRYGGEEFAVILPFANKEYAMEIARNMRSKVEELKIIHEYSSVSPYITISLGVHTVIPSEHEIKENLIKGADTALYLAKSIRNHVADL